MALAARWILARLIFDPKVEGDICSMGFAGYVTVCVQLYCRCFTVLHLVVAVLHYMFRPTRPSSKQHKTARQTTRKGKQTSTPKRYSKINEENRTTKKHKWKRAKGNHVQVKPAKQIPSGI
jgi:hypothetical protein